MIRASWSLRKTAKDISKRRTVVSYSSKLRAETTDPTKHKQRSDSYGSVGSLSLGLTYDRNARMSEMGRRGSVPKARKLFDEMSDRDSVSYASMISIYIKNNELHKAERIYSEIPEGMKSIVADSAMVHAYAKAGRISDARAVFDGMPERNAFSWSSLISGYFMLGMVADAVEVLEHMPEKHKNEITWTNVIMGFARNGMIDEARKAFDQMPAKNMVSWTSMVKGYVDNGLLEEALDLFSAMPHHNLYSWNIILGGLLDKNWVDKAKEVFDSMPRRNVVSWTTMVTGLARNGMIELARQYFDQMPNKDVSAWNAMITVHANEGRMDQAGELFCLMSNRNNVTWNAMINGYAKCGNEDEAFTTFMSMLQSGNRPNETSLTGLLTSCGSVIGVLQAHGLIVQLGFEIETPLTNTLITMYCKNGDITSARIAFNNLNSKDSVTWTAIISAYSNHGYGIQALQAFARMLRSGHIPDEVTFVGVLSACSHAGLVTKGQMLFNSMKSAYGLEPMAEHYACLVDILGRAGLVNEAVKVVHEMPRDKTDGAVLGALLSACKLNRDGGDELADHIGEELIELEPDCSGAYVLLANLYASCGKWEKFSKLRKKMKEREVRKVPGYSRVEVDGNSHVFLVGDKSHPEMKSIYSFLQDKLVPLMKDSDCEIEYIPVFL